MYKWFLCVRYLFSRAIPFAALVVVASSVALLIIIVSVMEGFRTDHKQKIRGTSADLSVRGTQYIGLRDPERVARLVAGVEGVQAATPFVDIMVLYRNELTYGPELQTRFVRAFDLEREREVGEFTKYVEAALVNRLVFGPDAPRSAAEYFAADWVEHGLWRSRGSDPPKEVLPPILAGREALREGLYPGKRISLTAFSPTTQRPVSREFRVVGYFKTGIYELDWKGLLMSMDVADEFLGLQTDRGQKLASGVRIAAEPDRRDDASLAGLRDEIRELLERERVFFSTTRTWFDEKAALLQALKVEKALTGLILGLTVLFGGFMIFIILTVQVVEKTRDIGVLQSMGATQWGAASIFLRMGVVLALVGTLIGSVYGLGFAYFVNTIQRWVKLLTGYEVFPLTVFYMDRIPVQFHASDLLSIILPTVVVATICSALPAWRAARKKPVDALRYE